MKEKIISWGPITMALIIAFFLTQYRIGRLEKAVAESQKPEPPPAALTFTETSDKSCKATPEIEADPSEWTCVNGVAMRRIPRMPAIAPAEVSASDTKTVIKFPNEIHIEDFKVMPVCVTDAGYDHPVRVPFKTTNAQMVIEWRPTAGFAGRCTALFGAPV